MPFPPPSAAGWPARALFLNFRTSSKKRICVCVCLEKKEMLLLLLINVILMLLIC